MGGDACCCGLAIFTFENDCNTRTFDAKIISAAESLFGINLTSKRPTAGDMTRAKNQLSHA